ncbi:2'-5' RNA ligase family protein [Sandaracinobacteroides hominis]|uniref:2'-5' RNA ligase family protein n=1 Tax=Sandaracinobacteroides hominis TaxID=2780086 RepID=UPI0018F74EDE|nr:2'-5' RNA ligase family protein [Sandaracinobacteroides hominis]
MAELWPAGWKCAHDERISPAPLILTAALPPALQAALDARRDAAALAHAPSHLTLFRHLPGARFPALLNDARRLLRDIGAPTARLLPPLHRERLWLAPIEAPALDELRERLAECWQGLLAPGDKAPARLHISLGRRADPPPALAEGPWRLPGLLFWQYGEACWTPLVALNFRR